MAGRYVIRELGDDVAIIFPRSEVHALRVALRPIRAGEATSKATQAIRDRLDKGLAKLSARKKR